MPSFKHVVLAAAPLSVLVLAGTTIIADILRIGQIMTGNSIIFGNNALSLIDLPQFTTAVPVEGLPLHLAASSILLRIACSLTIAVEIILVTWGAIVLNQLALHIADVSETSRDMSRRWRSIAVVLASSFIAIGLTTTATQALLLFETQNEHARGAFLGGNYGNVTLAAPSWPLTLLMLSIMAAAMSYRLHAGIDPEAKAPIDLTARSAEILDIQIKRRDDKAS